MWRRLLFVSFVVGVLGAIPLYTTFDSGARQSRPRLGAFRVECAFVRQARIDPIVAWGRISPHLHDFFGNTDVASTSTSDSLRRATSTCSAIADRSGYWAPTLMTPSGLRMRPERAIVYYRNRPVARGQTVAFPPGLRMVAGGSFPNSYWTCEGDSDTALRSRRPTIPDCGRRALKAHVIFPSCWDGEHLDSADHRSHVVYGLDSSGRFDAVKPRRCPASHPVKIPQLDLRVQYDVSDPVGYRLSDGRVLPHADFFDAWNQRALERLVKRCLGRAGSSCGLVRDR